MKSILLLAFAFVLFGGCHKSSADPVPICIQQKIDEFKLEPRAEKIIKIEKPDDPMFWFVEITIDSGELVVSEDCRFSCITDCYCETEHGCDPAVFNFPQEIIWEK